jgi:hypothetical protein
MNQTDTILWGAIAILLTALIGSIFYRHHKSQERFLHASDEFRKQFDSAKHKLIQPGARDRQILIEEFPVHEKAFIAFLPHLSHRQRMKIQKKWDAYKKHYKERTDVGLIEMIGSECLDISRLNDLAHVEETRMFRCNQVIQHIDSLLAFTKIKM